MNSSWMQGWRNWKGGLWKKRNMQDKQSKEDFQYEKKLQKWQRKKMKARREHKPFDLKMPTKPGLGFFGDTGEDVDRMEFKNEFQSDRDRGTSHSRSPPRR